MSPLPIRNVSSRLLPSSAADAFEFHTFLRAAPIDDALYALRATPAGNDEWRGTWVIFDLAVGAQKNVEPVSIRRFAL